MKSKLFWIIAFSSVIVLAMLFLFGYEWQGNTLWGLPSWVAGFFFIQMYFSVLMYLFGKTYWQKDPGL